MENQLAIGNSISKVDWWDIEVELFVTGLFEVVTVLDV
jgi:hypothetical protein